MKHIIFIISILLSTTILNADSISALIDSIKKATPQEKRVLINKLKLRLKDSNDNTRKEAIGKLRSSFGRAKQYHYHNALHKNTQKTNDHTTQMHHSNNKGHNN